MKQSETRQRIIETAAELFYQNGYNSTGINEVIAESGIAKATLYSHFRSKEELCIAFLELKNSSFLSDLRTHCERQPKGKDQVLAVFDFLADFFLDKTFNGCWCINTVSEIPKDNELIRAEIKLQKQLFLKLIQTLVHQNNTSLLDSEAELLAKRVYLLYEGAVAESHLHQAEWPIVEARAMCAVMIN